MVNNFPFEQVTQDHKIVRTFNQDVDDDELKWHQDLKDRWVTILQSEELSKEMVTLLLVLKNISIYHL